MPETIPDNAVPAEVIPDAQRRVAIVGEIPFAGRALAKAVVDAGMIASVLCPDSAVAAGLRAIAGSEHIELVEGDLGNSNAVNSVMEGAYGVCFVSPIGMTGRTYRADPHLADMRNVIDAAESHGLRKLVYHSSLCADAKSRSRALRDAAAAEQMISLNQRCQEFSIRTGPLIGRGDAYMTEIVSQARAPGPFMTMLDGGAFIQPLAVTDFARCMAALFSPRFDALPKAAYAVAGPEKVSLLELMDSSLNLMHRNKVKFHVPPFALKLSSLLGSAKFKERVGLLFDDFAVDENDAMRFLGMNAHMVAPIEIQRELIAE